MESGLERAVMAIEEAAFMDPVSEKVADAAAKLFPGKVKDAASGTWMGHALHPLLTDIPIGCWTSAMLLDLVGGKGARKASDRLVLAGVLAALPTAYTGLSEWVDCRGREMRVGTVHALSNYAGIFLYAASYFARKKGDRARGVRLGLLGGAALSAGGYLGGHLSYRLGVGVDQTIFQTPPEDWTRVLAEGELAEGAPAAVQVEGVPVLVYRSGSEVFAIADRCSHRGGPLHEGEVDKQECTVTCPWHASTFSMRSGEVVTGPATAPQPCYDVRVETGQILVRPRKGGH